MPIRWSDQSGRGNDITQRSNTVTFDDGAQNLQDAVHFANPGYLQFPRLQANSTDAEYVFVLRTPLGNNSQNSGGFLRAGTHSNQHYSWGNNLAYENYGTNVRQNNIPINNFVDPNDFHIVNTSGVSAGPWSMTVNGDVASSKNSNGGSTFHNDWRIGRSTGGEWEGDVGEVIFLNRVLNAAEKLVVTNYLHTKYDVADALGADIADRFAGDTAGNGEHDFDLFGVARENGASVIDAGAAGFGIEVASLAADGDALLAAHDGGTGTTNAGVPAGVEKRWGRTWYVDASGGAGAATATFNFSDADLTLTNESSFFLLTSSNGTSWTDTGVAASVNGDTITFSSATLSDGWYTLGTSSAVPVVTTTSATLDYGIGSGAQAIDPNLTLSDSDSSSLASATIQITANYDSAEDVLAAGALPAGITAGAFDTGTGSLPLSGTASVADYQTALRGVTFQNDTGSSLLEREITFTAVDPDTNSGSGTRNISLLASVSTDDVVWNGSVDDNWTTGANWDIGRAPDSNDIAIFRDNGAGPVDLAGDTFTVEAVEFDGAGSFTLDNGTLFTNMIDQQATASGSNVMDAEINATALVATIDAGSLEFANTVNSIASGTITVGASGELRTVNDGTPLGNAEVVLNSGTLTFIAEPPTSPGGVSTDLELWLDASDIDGDGISGNNPADGDTVTSWADKSGNNRNMVSWTGTPTYETNEVGGLPAVRFDANNENLQMADPSNEFFAHDTFLVFRSGNGALFGPSWGAPIGVKDGPDEDRMWMFQGNEDRFWGNETPAAVRWNGIDIPSANNFDMSGPTGNASMGEYMVLKVTANVGPAQPNNTGNGDHVREYIVGTRTDAWANARFDTAEVIAYDRVLSPAEGLAVEAYLRAKYGIDATPTPLPNNISVTGVSAIQANTAAGTVGLGTLTIAAGATLNVGGNFAFDGTTVAGATMVNLIGGGSVDPGGISESAAGATIQYSGSGNVTLDDAGSYTGTTTVKTGVQVNASDGAAFGTDAAGTTVEDGGSINFTGGTYTETFNITGNGLGTGDGQAEGAMKKSAGSNVIFQGLITVAADSRIYSAGNELFIDGGLNVNGNTLTLDAQNRINIRSTSVSGGGLVRVEGNDLVDIEVSNTNYSGDFELFNDGQIDLHADNALGDHNGTTTVLGSNTNIGLRNGRTHRSNFVIEGGKNNWGAFINWNGSSTIDGNVTLAADARIWNNDGGSSVTITGNVTGNHTLEKVGSGKLILGGTANNYDLLDWVDGDLQVKHTSGLGTNTAVVLEPGRTLEFNPDSDITAITGNQSLTLFGGTLASLANQVTITANIDVGLFNDMNFAGDGDLVLSQPLGNGETLAGAGTVAAGNLQVWYDASDIDGDGNSGNNPADGDTVTDWADKSGNNRHLVTWTKTPTFEANEINSLPAVRFDENDENLQMADPSNEYFAHDTFLVFRAGQDGGVQRTTFGPSWGAPIGVKSGPDADRMWMMHPNEDRFWNNETPAAVRRNGIDIPSANNFDMSTTTGGASMGEYMILNVTANIGPGTATTNNNNGNGSHDREYIVGTRTDAWGNSRWDTAEIIVYDTALNPVDMQKVEAYLAAKYGIAYPTIENNLNKSGSGRLTLGGDNTFNGTVTVHGGTVVAAHDNAFGLKDGGDIVITRSTAGVGFSSGVDISGEDIAGAGIIVNVDGTNSYNGDIEGLGMTVNSIAGELTLNGTVDLDVSDVVFDGAGNVIVNSVVSGNLAGGASVPDLGGVTNSLEVWYDASDIDGDGNAGNNPADGDTVTAWADKSLNGRHLTTGTGSPTYETNEIGGLPAVRFNANNENLYMADSSNKYFANDVFLVFRAGQDGNGATRTTFGPSWGAPIGAPNGNNADRTWMLEGNTGRFWNSEPPSAVNRNGMDIPSDNNFDILAATENTSLGQYMVLNVTAGPNNGTQIREYVVGTRMDQWANSRFDTAEIIAFSSTLSSSDRAKVQAYLAQKYSIDGDYAVTFSNDLTKTGTGTVTLTANNTFTGDVTITAGTLVAASDTALGTIDAGTTVTSGATLALDNTNLGYDGGTDAGVVDIAAGESLTIAGNGYDDGGGAMGAISNIAGSNVIYADIVAAASALPAFDTTGLQAWYDASTLSLNDGDPVAAWADQSGNNRNLVSWTGTPTFETNEVGGLPAVRFDQNDENLQMADPSNEYFAQNVFLVFRAGQDNGVQRNSFGPSWGAPIGVKNGNDADRMWMFQGGEDRFWSSELPSAVRRNGVDVSSANNFDLGAIDASQYMMLQVTAGANNGTQTREYIVGTRTDQWANARFDTAEILVYDRALTPAEVAGIEFYLNVKYFGAQNPVPASGTIASHGVSDTLTIAGDASFAGLTIDGDGNTTVNGALSGVGAALTKTGDGTLTLTAANTYSGGTAVASGTLVAANTSDSATGPGAVTVLTADNDYVDPPTLTGGGTIRGPVSGQRYTLINPNDGAAFGDGSAAGFGSAGKLVVNAGDTVTLNDSNAVPLGEFNIVNGILNLSGGATSISVVGGGNVSGTGDINADLFAGSIYQIGHQWNRATDWNDNGGGETDSQTDSLDSSVWSYHSVDSAPGNWYEGARTDLSYDGAVLQWGAGPSSQRITKTTLSQNSAPALFGEAPLALWTNPTGQTITVDIRGTLDFTWTGETVGGNSSSQTTGHLLGYGAASLLGGDLADPDNNGAAAADTNYDVVQFFANDEPGFGGGEFSYNVFDNQVGGGNAKWCCSSANDPGTSLHVGYQLATPKVLTHFTITSDNDSGTGRDPAIWQIQGSNDGTNWDTIFDYGTGSSPFTAGGGSVENKVLLYTSSSAPAGIQAQDSNGPDFESNLGYTYFRYNVDGAGGDGTGAHALGELEFFGMDPVALGPNARDIDYFLAFYDASAGTWSDLTSGAASHPGGSNPQNASINVSELGVTLDAGDQIAVSHRGQGSAGPNQTQSLADNLTIEITGFQNGGATISPGDLGAGDTDMTATSDDVANEIGSLSTNSVTLTSTSTVDIDINGAATAGTDYDQIDVTDGLTLAGASLDVSVGTGYTPASGNVFVIGQNDGGDVVSGTFNGLANGDIIDGGGATFQLFYDSDATGAQGAGNDVALVDVTPNVQFSSATFHDDEGAGTTMEITLTRSGTLDFESTVQVAFADGTATGGSALPADYDNTTTPVTVTFNPSEAVATASLTIFDDTVPEANETVNLSVTSTSNAIIGTQATATFTIDDNDNQQPTADAGGPYATVEGVGLTLDGSGSSDTDVGDVLTYDWTVNGNALPSTTSNMATLTWSDLQALGIDDGTMAGTSFTVSLIVTDDKGAFNSASDPDSTTLTLTNTAPTATLANDGPVDEGSSADVTLSGASDPSNGDLAAGLRYSYDLDNNGSFDDGAGDGTYAGALSSASYTVPATILRDGDSLVTVTARVLDDDGGYTDHTTVVTVRNVAPVVDAGASQTISEGSTLTLDPATFTDAGVDDTHTATIDWGDGSVVEAGAVTQGAGSGSVAGSHAYDIDGSYTVTLTVTDNDGDSATDTLTVTVNNAAPTGTITGPAEASPSESLSFEFSGNDVSVDDRDNHLACSVNWGDGSPDEDLGNCHTLAPVPLTHEYLALGLYTVTLSVSDDDTTTTILHSVNVTNDPRIDTDGNLLVPDSLDGSNEIIITDTNGGGQLVMRNDVGYGPFYPTTNVVRIITGDGPDRISIASDRICADIDAGGGDNYIASGGCSDTIFTTFGKDILLSGGGNDIIDAGDGNNKVDGGTGDDQITAGSGRDELLGREGNDIIFSGGGNDLVAGDVGDDVLHGGDGDDTISGGGDNDIVLGEAGNDRLFGRQGRDIVLGGLGGDDVQGNDDDDIVAGGETTLAPAQLVTLLGMWTSSNDFTTRVNAVLGGAAGVAANMVDDTTVDGVIGHVGQDLYLAHGTDQIHAIRSNDAVHSLP